MDRQAQIAGRIKKVEEILNVSQATLDEIQEKEEILDVEIVEAEEYPLAERTDSVFQLTELKKKYDLAQQSLQQIINFGQNLMSQTVTLELNDMKASEISAIAQLSQTIYTQLRGMVNMLKDITEIELNVKELNSVQQGMGKLPSGTSFTQHNTTVIQGTTSDIIKQIKEDTNL